MKQIFSTKEFRVKFVVFDFTTEATPQSLRRERPTFSVAVMPHGLPPKTSFAAKGEVIAHTENPIEALAALKEVAPSFSTGMLNTRLLDLVRKWK